MPQAPRRRFFAWPRPADTATGPRPEDGWAAWDDLLAAADRPDPVHRAAALRLRDPLRGGETRMLIGRAGGAPVAGAALRARGRAGLVHLDHLLAAPNRYGPGLPWVGPGGREALADLLAGAPGDLLSLGEVPADWGLHDALAARAGGLHVVADSPVHRVDLARDPITARRRRDARRALRRADEAGLAVRRRFLREPADVRAALPAVIGLVSRARLRGPLDPYAAGPPGSVYLAGLLGALGDAGGLRISLVEVGDAAVAVAVAAVLRGGAAGVRAAIDRDAPLHSAGWIAQIGLADGLRADGVRHMDIGSGGDAHKAEYATAQATVAMIVPLSRAGRAAMAAWSARRRLRRRPQGAAGADCYRR